jgi:hypothetical protein
MGAKQPECVPAVGSGHRFWLVWGYRVGEMAAVGASGTGLAVRQIRRLLRKCALTSRYTPKGQIGRKPECVPDAEMAVKKCARWARNSQKVCPLSPTGISFAGFKAVGHHLCTPLRHRASLLFRVSVGMAVAGADEPELFDANRPRAGAFLRYPTVPVPARAPDLRIYRPPRMPASKTSGSRERGAKNLRLASATWAKKSRASLPRTRRPRHPPATRPTAR